MQFKNYRCEQFREETEKDEHLGKVSIYLDKGWPNKIHELET